LDYGLAVSLLETGAIFEAMESTAHEKRQWVRLTYACNNKCVFCHDSIVQSGEMVPREILEKEISEGQDQDCRAAEICKRFRRCAAREATCVASEPDDPSQ